ncbi:MAG: helicase C-terminal domain-containing protein [Promethearchaeota archaeon]
MSKTYLNRFWCTKIDYLSFFPYDNFRKEQENIIKQIESDSRLRKNILLVAPNGTGKTIIALSGLLPLAYEKNLKIIYMCRTHSQNRRIIKELIKISQKISDDNLAVKLNGISIRGRNEMCVNDTLVTLKLNPKESMSVCSDLRQNRNCTQFLNLLKKMGKVENPVLLAPEIFNRPIDAEELIDFCKDEKICPYFLCKFLLKEMKVIICNYQWLFNPYIRDLFLQFVDQELKNCILVLDECHNIIDVATEVNSERITPYSLRLCLKDLEMYRSPIVMQDFVRSLLDQLKEKKNAINHGEEVVDPNIYLKKLFINLGYRDLNGFKNLIQDIYELSISIHEEKLANGSISRDYLGSIAEFWLKWLKTFTLDNYFFCFNLKVIKGKKSISLEIVALDPREIVIPILKTAYTSLNLSGTVNPYVYNNLMGLNESGKRYKGIIAASPFDRKHIKAIITEGIDTKRANRTPAMFKKMINKINEVLTCTPANIGIFCASYQILRGLLTNGIDKVVNRNRKKLFIEEQGLSASENNLMVDNFKTMASDGGAVLLGVCGGRNSEGEDYPGNHMNSVIIAGFPYHLPTPRVDAKIKYYDKVFNKQGWNFAYLYPAVQRANQASGRPIRKITDKGAIIFMDSRFKTKYKWISEWVRNELKIIPDKPKAIYQALNPFWNSM